MKLDSLPGQTMRPGVAHLLELGVLGEFYARFSQDAQVNETLYSSHGTMEQLMHVHFVFFTIYQKLKTLFSRTTMPDRVCHNDIP